MIRGSCHHECSGVVLNSEAMCRDFLPLTTASAVFRNCGCMCKLSQAMHAVSEPRGLPWQTSVTICWYPRKRVGPRQLDLCYAPTRSPRDLVQSDRSSQSSSSVLCGTGNEFAGLPLLSIITPDQPDLQTIIITASVLGATFASLYFGLKVRWKHLSCWDAGADRQ